MEREFWTTYDIELGVGDGIVGSDVEDHAAGSLVVLKVGAGGHVERGIALSYCQVRLADVQKRVAL